MEGRRSGQPRPADAGSPPRSRLSPGSGRLVAAIGTQGDPLGLLSPSLPRRWAALEDFLPLRPPRCPPDMVGHLQLQGMDESLKEKSREGLLDSPDSGLPPSPSPPFYALSPGEGRAGGSGGADPPVPGHRREAKDGKVVRAKLGAGLCPLRPREGEGLAKPRHRGQRGKGLCSQTGAPLGCVPPRCPATRTGGRGLSLCPIAAAVRCWHCHWCAQAGGWPDAGRRFCDTLTEVLAIWLGKLLITAWE